MLTLLHTITQKLLPAWIYRRLIGDWNTEGFKKYAANTSWLFFGQAFSFVVSFFMVAIVARYLGPENLGKLSYAQSFVAIFSVLASLGIDQILYRDLVNHPEDERKILGTAFLIKVFFGSLTTIVAVGASFLTSSDTIFTLLILILSLSFIIQPFTIASTVFGARVKSKYTALIQVTISIVVPLSKLFVIFLGKGILFFAGIILIDVIISAILSLYFYIKIFHLSPLQWRIDCSYGLALIKNSAPLLLAGLSGYLFARIDQVMLQHMLGSEAVGLYSASVSLTDVFSILSGVVVASLFPALLNARKTDTGLYHTRLKHLFTLLLSINVLFAVALTVLSPLIISTIFGTAFLGSITILMIFAWKLVAATPLIVVQQYLIAENKTRIYLSASIFTAALNILLNYILIPLYGPHGAAIATVISYASYLFIPALLYLTNKLKHGI